MRAPRTLDVSELPDYAISSQAPLWWGQLLLALIEGTMFAILIAMYFYYRLRVDTWPPPGTQLPPQLLPAISLAMMILSCLGTYQASEAAKKDDRWAMAAWLLFNVALGIGAMVVRGFAWAALHFTWASDIHGSVVWTILGLHTLDAVADLLFTAVLILLLVLGHHGAPTRIAVHVDSIVWYFVVLIWIPLYVTIYWGPHLVGGPR